MRVAWRTLSSVKIGSSRPWGTMRFSLNSVPDSLNKVVMRHVAPNHAHSKVHLVLDADILDQVQGEPGGGICPAPLQIL